MAKIKDGVDPKLVARVAKEEMAKVLGHDPGTYDDGKFIGHQGESWFTPNYAGLQITHVTHLGPNHDTIEVSSTANSGPVDHPNTHAAAKVALNRLKEHGLIE